MKCRRIASVECDVSLPNQKPPESEKHTFARKMLPFRFQQSTPGPGLLCVHLDQKVVEMTAPNLPIAMLLAARPPKCVSFLCLLSAYKSHVNKHASASRVPAPAAHVITFVPMCRLGLCIARPEPPSRLLHYIVGALHRPHQPYV
jgi:hypothetical protein